MIEKQTIKALFLLMLCPFFGAAQQQTQLLSFEDALHIMTEQNPALLRVKQEIKQKEYEVKAKRGMHLPQVSVSAQAISMSDALHVDLTEVRDAITPVYSALGNYGVFSGVPNPGNPGTVLPDDVSTAVVRQQLLDAEQTIMAGEWDKMIQEKNFAAVTANVMWPIYAGGKIRGANDAADVEVKMSQEELRNTEGALLTELVSRYYGLALAVQVRELRQQILEGMENHYSDAQKLFDNGMIAKVELLHATVSRNEAERELKMAERNIEIIQAGLAATLASDSLTQVVPVSNLFMNKELTDLSYWIQKAKINNPQLKQIEGKRELVEIKHGIEKKEYLPTIAMMGTYNMVDKNLSPYMPNWLVGVGMKWTVFNGMARKNDIKASETMQNQVDFAEQKAHNDLEAYLTKLYQELQMQIEQRTELETTLDLSEEYLRSTQTAFNEGLATSTAVVDAFTKVAQVKTLSLKVLYEYDVALACFMQTAGAPEEYIDFCSGENVITGSIK
ncbi:TolC family protein [Prolixibacteraceae bacterium Z1-6]|uniref:TolC family protein n=1 Tax=Draconibacterium aestuarii TaxID=2998507 RepID=A0A9X3F6R7_9BACT|nr:TolC family protein [Prolixibacteraceae bacterium Z1-6]